MSSAAKKLSIRLEAVGGDKVRQEFKAIGSDGIRAFNQITHVITPANDNLKAINETAKAFNGVLKQAATLAGAYLGLRGLTSIFKGIVNTNKEFESLSGSLKTVTGSAEGAKEAFAIIEKFAIDTPYQLDEIVEAFIRLKALGLDPSMAALTSYGNTASAFGKNIMDFTDALSNAVMYNFKSLRSFGIMAQTQGDVVKFTFQGITTEVAKDSRSIEAYLRKIGDVNFAGAMAEQMNTMGGTMSNIEDAFGKLARSVGENGLNQAIKEVLTRFNDMIGGANSAAKTIGEALATAVSLAGKAFFFLAENIETIITLLTVRLGSAALIKTWTFLRGSVLSLNTALIGTSTAGATAALGIKMMWSVSKLAAVQMYATAVAAGVLRTALMLVGGPVGVALMVAYALYKLVASHDAAKNAADNHAETLRKLDEEMEKTVQQVDKFSNKLSKDQSLAHWQHQLKVAEDDIKNLEKELKQTGGISLWQRWSPNFMLDEYEVFANDLAEILSESKYNLDEYQKKIWELATEYPDFTPQAKEIQHKLNILRAAEIDAGKARDEIKYIKNPELRSAEALEQAIKLPTVSTEAYEKNIEDIKKKIFELQDPYDQAMQKAVEWRDNALANLDSTKAGYDQFKADVERVYDDLVQKAKDSALKSSTDWKDGLTRGMQSVYADAADMGKSTESLVKDSFKSMEDTLVTIVMTGKMKFSDLVNSIVEGMVRMAIQYAVIKPLMGGLMGYFGIPTAHTGGVIGTDTLSSRAADPNIFANAVRYHTGGLVGNEIPIIAQRGETVFTKGQMEALGTELNVKTPVYVNVNVQNNASGVKATATPSKDTNGNLSIDVIVEQIEGAIGKNITKGEGLSPILEQRYALNPAYGSYR